MAYHDHSNDRPVRKTVQVFKNGRSRAIRIPKEFEFEADQVEMSKDEKGNLIVSPILPRKSWAEVLDSLVVLRPEDDFPEMSDPPPRPLEIDWEDEQ